MIKNVGKTLNDNKGLLLFILLSFMFRSSFADWNTVPTGSMKPTIIEGDRILVNKMAYDIRVPFTHHSLYKVSDPLPGDIVIFDSKVSDKRLVKRIIGVPGDVVEMRDNTLFINGKKLSYRDVTSTEYSSDKIEYIADMEHFVRFNKGGSRLSNFDSIIVANDHYLALGDNRDHSADSRVIGFVPRGEIVGRTKSVVMSLDYENYFIPRLNRFFHSLSGPA